MELLKFDVRFINIATDYMKGDPIQDLAEKYHMPAFKVTEILSLPEIRRYSEQYIGNIGYLNRAKRAKLISQLIDDKIIENEEAEICSRKDITDLVKMAQDEERLVKDRSPVIQINAQENNYNNFIKDLDVH